MLVDECHVTRVNQGLFTTTMEAEKRDPGNEVAILISIVSNSHYGMPKGQIHINLPPGHPIMSFETIEIKMVAVSVKRSIGREKWLCACVMCWSHRVVS